MKDYTRSFDRVHSDELKRAQEWRRASQMRLARGGEDASEPPTCPGAGVAGWANSGGGIRSAAFSMGVLQALEAGLAKDGVTALRHFDYLSTVSGGGYLGTSVIVGMNADVGRFPYATDGRDKVDNLAVGHVRNYSRYLLPNGFPDLVGSVAVILRGLVANFAMVLGIVLMLAGITGVFNPNQAAYRVPDLLGFEGYPFPSVVLAFGDFAYTKILLLFGAILMLAWGLVRSLGSRLGGEFHGAWYRVSCILMGVTALCAFMEVQPFAIVTLFGEKYPGTTHGFFSLAKLTELSPYLAALGSIGAFASGALGNAAKAAKLDRRITTVALAVLAKLAAWAMMLTLPVLIWLLYLNLAVWTDVHYLHRPTWMAHLVELACGKPDVKLVRWMQPAVEACADKRVIADLFIYAGAGLTALTWIFSPNANSLHRLYRDRLAKAFLFVPERTSLDEAPSQDPRPIRDLALAELDPSNGPVHLINCALNVQASQAVNRRGRNADFFVFSSSWSGSQSTGYVRSASAQTRVPLPDVATAMAVSGAAASSNMGANTIVGLAPTLSLLNVRLGYWMVNPASLDPEFGRRRSAVQRLKALLRFYFVEEMLGLLDECSDGIYLTDGGHIENLGLYPLLRRRCRLIVVVDAEADPLMTFASLIVCQRFARIDLGVRIDLPWDTIGDADPKGTRSADRARSGATHHHVAVGGIEYDDGSKGILVYVKASLTGDENDYIRYYKSCNPSFPHETTGDQFFSEEQFEAYRSLGFHCLHGALREPCSVAGLDRLVSRSGGPVPADLRAVIERPTEFEFRPIAPQSSHA